MEVTVMRENITTIYHNVFKVVKTDDNVIVTFLDGSTITFSNLLAYKIDIVEEF